MIFSYLYENNFPFLTALAIFLMAFKSSSRVSGIKVIKRAKMRNRYNQAQHLNQDTNWKVTTSQLDLTNVFVFLPRGAQGWTVASVCGIITNWI